MVKYYENPSMITPEGIIRREAMEEGDTIWFFDCRQIMDGFKFDKKDSNFRKDDSYIEVTFKKDIPGSLFAGEGARFFFLGLDPKGKDLILEFRKLWANKKNDQFVGFGYYRNLKYTEEKHNFSYTPLGYEEENSRIKTEIGNKTELEKRFRDAGFQF